MCSHRAQCCLQRHFCSHKSKPHSPRCVVIFDQIYTKLDKSKAFKDYSSKEILKSPGFFLFGANLAQFRLKSDSPVKRDNSGCFSFNLIILSCQLVVYYSRNITYSLLPSFICDIYCINIHLSRKHLAAMLSGTGCNTYLLFIHNF